MHGARIQAFLVEGGCLAACHSALAATSAAGVGEDSAGHVSLVTELLLGCLVNLAPA
jgi:hypothetical protein